jgi:DNA polymerase-3 subunit epsilon
MRQVVLDTETTGLNPAEGHRIIEIGCVELINRKLTGNNYHQYMQPQREIDAGAIEVHGITNEFLEDKPRFEDLAQDFLDYIRGAELIIHNAPFDVGFLNYEFKRCELNQTIADLCAVQDTLALARRMHPGQKNNLDALCKRYGIDNSRRELHGALLDAEILADVYLSMTGGQVSLLLGGQADSRNAQATDEPVRRLKQNRPALTVVRADDQEIAAHRERMAAISKASNGPPVWDQLEKSESD